MAQTHKAAVMTKPIHDAVTGIVIGPTIHMTNTIRAIAVGAERIVAGEATPTRVDPATVN